MEERNALTGTTHNQTDTRPLQPLNFTDILDGIFSLYRRHFRLFAPIAVIGLCSELIEYVLLDFIPQDSLSLPLAIILSVPLLMLSIGGIVVATAAFYAEEPMTVRVALGRVGQQFFRLLGCTVLWLLVIGVLGITIIGIPFAFYFAVRWGFFVETLLLEEISVRDALKRSSELVRGVWWRMCGMLLAVFLLSAGIHAVFEISLGFMLVLTGIANEIDLIEIFEWAIVSSSIFGPDNLMLYMLTRGIHLAISVITFPIWVIGITLLYLNQRLLPGRGVWPK